MFHVDIISRNYPGWSLTEIKSMPLRERNYWLALIKWRLDNDATN